MDVHLARDNEFIIMDAHTSTTLEALERTAAWVQQVQVQAEQMKNSPDGEVLDDCNEEMHVVDEDDLKIDHSDKDDNSLTDHHDEALKMAQAFPPYVPKGKNGKGGSNYAHIDVQKTVKEFKEALEKYGISQRFACLHVMENTSQGNLSFLLDKGKNKLWSEISPRGRIPYIRMRRWLDNPEEQKATLELLHRSKDYKKGTRIGQDTILTKREKFSVFQLLVLCRVFEEDQNPSLSTRALLADKLEAPLERITIWFQNQRARGFPAKKLLKESNLSKDNVDMNFSELSSKKDHGMRKSNTPLSNGNTSNSFTLPIDYSKLSATVSQSNDAKTTCLGSLLGTTTAPVQSSSTPQSASFPHLPSLQLQLLNMTQPLTSEQMKMTSSMPMGQTFSPFPGFPPHMYASSVGKNSPTNSDALNFLNMYQQINIKQEPRDPECDSIPVPISAD